MNGADPSAILMEGHWFAGLTASFRDFLLDQGRLLALHPGQALFRRGDPPSGLYAMLDGALEIGAVDADGRAAVLTVAEPPSWFGEIAVVDGRPRTHDGTAVQASRILHVAQGPLAAYLTEHPQHWRDIAALLAEKLRLAFVATEAAALLPAGQRLAARLLMIAEGYHGAAAPRHDIHLSQDRLAAMLALSRQTVNQLLKKLEAQGIVTLRPGSILLRDAAALRHAAGIGGTGRAQV